MGGQTIFDREEHARAVEPETAEDRHEIDEVGNLMTDPGEEAGKADVEDGLQNDDRNDEDDAPGDHFGRRYHHDQDDHDDDAGKEIQKIADDGRNGQCSSRELESSDHRRSAADRPGTACHALSCVLEEEDTDDEITDEVVDAPRRVQYVAEDEPEGEH